MATLPNDGSSDLSFEDSLLKMRIESELGFKFENCSREDLTNLVIQFARKSNLLDDSVKTSLLTNPNVNFSVEVPEQPKQSLGLFANLLIKHLQALGDTTIYYGGLSHRASLIADEILAETDLGIEWLNYALSGSIQFLQENQLKEFSEDDVNLVNLIVNSKQLSIYTAVKVLKQLIDRLSSTAFKSNQTISNSTFTENQAFMQLLEAIYFTGYPQEGN